MFAYKGVWIVKVSLYRTYCHVFECLNKDLFRENLSRGVVFRQNRHDLLFLIQLSKHDYLP